MVVDIVVVATSLTAVAYRMVEGHMRNNSEEFLHENLEDAFHGLCR